VPVIAEYLESLNFSTELLLVNDGSTDNTLKKLRAFQKKHPFKVISYQQNQGKGYALKTGMAQAQGEYHLFMDVDLSVPLEEIEQLVKLLDKKQVVIGTRRRKKSQITRRQNLLRENLGKAFTQISKNWLGVEVSDFTCGFKCFPDQISSQLFPQIRNNRWGFDSEILFLAKQNKFKIKELPVAWQNDPRSKVKFPQDLLRSIKELFQVRWNFWRGRYDGRNY